MKTIEEMIVNYVSKGMTINQAENYACQEIILNKISKSTMANNVLIKGGVVMFNITHNLRRATIDLDFDFIRYDISDQSIRVFVDLLNRHDTKFIITANKIEPLHQDDYQGKRVWTTISDKTRKINFKLDIGVHTMHDINQKDCCFYFDDNQVTLKVNPPEQMVSEKIFSLAKHGAFSTRFKDILDVYYFIDQNKLNKNDVKNCLGLLIMKRVHGIKSIEDIYEKLSSAFEDKQFITNYKSSKDKWIDVDYDLIVRTILDFVYSL